MGMMINGKWENTPIAPSDDKGNFVRKDSVFRHWIKKDGSTPFAPEADRYHLYVSYACPWASRAIIFRALKGLENIISLSSVTPLMLDNGWTFDPEDTKYVDPLFNATYLYQIYQRADDNYTGKITVPVLWDKKTQTIVSNESADIIRMLNSEFNAFASNTYDYYPADKQQKIDEINAFIYDNINNGVYRAGFAQKQQAYERAFEKLFAALDELDIRLSKQRYLLGDAITEADWRFFTTIVRFDVVYYSHFKCNLRRICDYKNLFPYLCDLYQQPGIQETVNFADIKQHYYGSHLFINPTGIVPIGPEVDYMQPHERDKI